MHPFIETQKEWLRDNVPPFRPGDTVRVNVRVKEGEKERVQAFEGVCIAKRGGGVSETFTVRKVSNGIGVERIFPLHSPIIDKIEVVSRGDVRRAKLYYLRALRGRKARIKELREPQPTAWAARSARRPGPPGRLSAAARTGRPDRFVHVGFPDLPSSRLGD